MKEMLSLSAVVCYMFLCVVPRTFVQCVYRWMLAAVHGGAAIEGRGDPTGDVGARSARRERVDTSGFFLASFAAAGAEFLIADALKRAVGDFVRNGEFGWHYYLTDNK